MGYWMTASSVLLVLLSGFTPTAQAGLICIDPEDQMPIQNPCVEEPFDPADLVDYVLGHIPPLFPDHSELIPDYSGLIPDYDVVQELKDFLAGGCIEHPAGGQDAC